jgi:hypothetical protein
MLIEELNQEYYITIITDLFLAEFSKTDIIDILTININITIQFSYTQEILMNSIKTYSYFFNFFASKQNL